MVTDWDMTGAPMGLDIPRDGRVKLIYPYWSRSALGHGMLTEAFGA